MKTMQDIDVQKVKDNIGNQFDTVLILANRVREIKAGYLGINGRKQSPSMQAMLEVEAGEVGRERLFSNKTTKKRS